jgi:hypothetical protein
VSDQSQVSPDGLLEVLVKTVSIGVRFFVPLWAIAAIFALPTFLFFDVLVWEVETDLASIADWTGFVCTTIATDFCSFLIVSEVSDICLGGTASVTKAIGRTSIIGVGRLFGTHILVWVLMAICFVVAPALLFLLALVFQLVPATMPSTVTPLIVIGVAAATLVMIPFLFTDQMVVIEQRYWLSALRRSALLVLRSKTASFPIAFVFVALFTGSYVATSLLTHGVANPFGEVDVSDAGLPTGLERSIASSVVSVAFIPIQSIYLTLAYYYLKRRAGMGRDAATG